MGYRPLSIHNVIVMYPAQRTTSPVACHYLLQLFARLPSHLAIMRGPKHHHCHHPIPVLLAACLLAYGLAADIGVAGCC